ncbi:amino acid adenylation domain-containing protein [Pendulispora albinea]|uniref:Amino acid adenylation domain-containing protein n=1 Tax=Pendulispora albinea TaxID=2741071 RepID=A0ABZ2MB62_9BACT
MSARSWGDEDGRAASRRPATSAGREMGAFELMGQLASLGVNLWVDGGALKFRAPAGVLSASLKEQLRLHKQVIVEALGQAATGDLGSSPIPRAARGDGGLPLSFAQQRLWFLHALEPLSPVYNVPAVLRVIGQLDVRALERSLSAIVARHEVLRTRFVEVAGEPRQRAFEGTAVPLARVELEAEDEEGKRAETARRAREEAERPFDLANEPPLRATILRHSEREHVLLFTMHHIASDGWSMGVLVRELAALYEAYRHERPDPLPALPLQYADYAVWQRQWLSGDVLERQLGYWRKQLEGAPPFLELPTDRPRPAVRSARGAVQPIAWSKSLASELAAMSRRENVTLFTTLLAAFQVLLSRYTGQTDIVVGSPIANRMRPELEGLMGLFVNMLALRTEVSPRSTFRELLARVKDVTLGAYAHQDLPFQRLVEEIAPERGRAHAPIFQVVFAWQNAPASALALPELVLKPEPVETATARFDLSLTLGETDEGIEGSVEYSSDLFDASTIARLMTHYETLLRSILARPDQSVTALPLLTAPEREQMIRTYDGPRPGRPAEPCIHQLFEAQVARTPEAVAVIFGKEQLTYRALNQRANRLARRLRSMGVGPDVRVGICVERSIDMVVGLLGILKAGGAYAPLDPTYPRERLAFMLEDMEAAAVVTQAHLVSTALQSVSQSGKIKNFVHLDGDPPEVWGDDGENPANQTRADNLAYVIYTSGSTGKPKGVENHHRGLVNLLTWFVGEYALGPGDRVAQQAVMGFDACGLELWPALVAGATVYILDEETRLSVPLLAECFARERITVAHLSPVLAEPLVESSPPDLALRALLTGSDKVQRPPRRSPLFRFTNHYGPTETSILATWGPILASEGAEPPPIGRPLAGMCVYVLDRCFDLVPIGVVGELYIGGIGVGRGYAGRPDLTAERFIPDPFARSGARLYRTGDLARRRADGVIEFVGRSDQQVKIRGFRIEVAEVERSLLEHPAVREAAVVVREGGAGGKRLVAYVALDRASDVPVAALRAHLQERLPVFMVPAQIARIERMPISPNGKVDRKALPEPDASSAAMATYVAPATRVEIALAAIWAELIGVARAGRDDHFFALGGHSLLATQLVARVRLTLGVELPLREVFDAPALAEMAERIEAATLERTGRAPLPPIMRRPEGDAPEAALSFGQERMWLLDQLGAGAAYHVSGAVRLDGALQVDRLANALAAVVRRHEVLRSVFEHRDERVQVRVLPFAGIELPSLDLRDLPADARQGAAREHIAREAARPFDLTKGPLVRARVLRLDDRAYVLVFAMHHAVADAWSVGVLVRELAELYRSQPRADGAAGLPALPIQYADYAAWQRRALQGGTLEGLLAYWTRRLDGAPQVLELPTDKPRPTVRSFRGARRALAIPGATAAALEACCRREGVTLFMVSLAAWVTLLARYAGQRDILVGVPIAGRSHVELEALIGFFVNTLVIRVDLAGRPTVREVLAHTRAATLGAYAHQDLPFETLATALAPVRDPSRAPLVQVMFALQNAPMAPLLLGDDIALEPLPSESATAQFDLTMSVAASHGKLVATLEYSTDLFDEPTIERHLDHYVELLAAFPVSLERPVAELPLLGAPEREQTWVGWNDTARAVAPEAVHAFIRAQATRTPEAIAVVAGAEHLTYAALERRANQLAHTLRALGVGPESRVGVCLPRSIDLVVALLGVMKAGAAYLPLDPAYPDARLAFMVRDAELSAVVAPAAWIDRLGMPRARTVCPDADRERLALAPHHDPAIAVTGAHAAYVIYTSGSTGVPKGTVNTHAGLTNRLQWMQQQYGLTPQDRVLQKTPFTFDVSVWEFFWPLMVGARLVLARPDGHRDSRYLLELIGREQITTVHFVPTMLQTFLEEPDHSACAGLARVFCSGEALPAAAASRFFERLPNAALHNLYGPTEAAIDVTAWECRPGDEPISVPIGRPVWNTQLYVLDRELMPVPIGLPGELYLAGIQLARGYLARPDLTADRFIPNPFGAEPGARMYRTGDRVRYRPDGAVEFLGRLDQQVKLRGFRIELGEIEAVLLEHPAVSSALVTMDASPDGARAPRLIAYVVLHDATGEDAARLGEFAATRLADYMVPAAFVVLDAFPLSPSGKIDRKALPVPGAVAKADGTPPRTETEASLLEIFRTVLHAPRAGIHDSFFALGGDSIRAIQAAQAAQRDGRLAFRPRDLFEAPTVARLAARIAEGPHPTDEEAAGPLTPAEVDARVHVETAVYGQERLPDDVEDVLPLTGVQAMVVRAYDSAPPGSGVFHLQQMYEVRARDLSLAGIAEAIELTVRRHPMLRTRLLGPAGADGEVVQIVHRPGPVEVPLEDLTALDPSMQRARLEAALAHDRATRFARDGARGRLLRFHLFALAPDRAIVFVSAHHAVLDGWSNAELLGELAATYAAVRQGTRPMVPAKTNVYRELIALERDALRRDRVTRAFWDEYLVDAPRSRRFAEPLHEAPAHGAPVLATIDPGLAEAAITRAAACGVQLKSLLLAAFARLIAELEEQPSVTLATLANRRTARLSDPWGALGLFWNIVPIRVSPHGDGATPIVAVEAELAAIEPHAWMPFPTITGGDGHGLCTALFNYVHFHNLRVPNARELQVSHATPGHDRYHLPLNCLVSREPRGNGLHTRFEFDPRFFRPSEIARMARRYQEILDELVGHRAPSQPSKHRLDTKGNT